MLTVSASPAAAGAAQAVPPRSSVVQPAAVTQTLVSLTSPVKRGAYATIIVRTQPNTACSITVYYKSGPSSAKGLEPKTANTYGRCVWTWKVGTNTTIGTWRIVVKTGTLSKTYWFAVN
jgi:micrococcal nuclease